MTQEEKRELEIALSGYYPYGVYIEKNGSPMMVHDLYYDCNFMLCDEGEVHFCGGDISKMYLRPMSSITDEELEWIKNNLYIADSTAPYEKEAIIFAKYSSKYINFLCSRHLDYNGFIERGLAIAVTKENNPYIEEDE